MPPLAIFHTALPSELAAAPINPAWVIEGNPRARAIELTQSPDGNEALMVWDCSSGVFDWFYAFDETVYVLEGGMILDQGSPNERRVKAGDVVFFPYGSHARWHVEHYVRKFAVVRLPLPKSILTLLRLRRAIGRPVRLLLNWRSGKSLQPATGLLG